MPNFAMLYQSCLLGLSLALLAPAHAEQIQLDTPEGALAANRKIQCSLQDGVPALYTWSGDAYSRRQGERDQHLFKIVGMNIRQCTSIDGGSRGKGYRLLSREILLYLDPVSGAVLRKWRNPWLNREVEVLQTTNDPVNQPPQFPYKEDATPAARWSANVLGGQWFQTLTFPLFYHNVLQGDYQRYVGGAYHATEMFNFTGALEPLQNKALNEAKDVKVGWVRLSDWLPWMEMQGREGLLYIHAAGQRVSSFDELPGVLRDYIRREAPLYLALPAVDDERPNETSWTLFRKRIVGEKLRRGGY